MKKSIGVFLAYSPDQSIKSHGISRLLSFMLNGMLQNDDNNVVIATPAWFEKSITEFMQDQQIDIKKIELLTTEGVPYLLRIKDFLSKRKESMQVTPGLGEKTFLQRLFKKGENSLFNLFMHWVSISSTPTFILTSLCISLVGLLLSPLLLLGAISYITFRIMRKAYCMNKGRVGKILATPNYFFTQNRLARLIVSQLAELRHNLFARTVYHELRERELSKLIRLINARPDISVWFIPTLFWPEIKKIKAKKVIAAPDIVFVDFPAYFSDEASISTYNRITETIAAGDHFICYSEHVKQRHLVQAFAVDPNKITVISHGSIDLSTLFNKNMAKKAGMTQRHQSIQILQNYQKCALQNHAYLSDYNLSDMRFIFYSSQLRPYKNFHNLVRAYEILLRDRFINVKLVVTGDIKADPVLYQYILDKRLQFDVISLYDIPADVLAALNHLAVCAVNPTLFEGGFPFTFTEAYSVGTPSIMSNIPAVRAEIQDPTLVEHMLFDPHDVKDMVNKIEFAISHPEKLFELQAPLYQKFKQRDWKLVANEYVNLLTDFSRPAHVNV